MLYLKEEQGLDYNNGKNLPILYYDINILFSSLWYYPSHIRVSDDTVGKIKHRLLQGVDNNTIKQNLEIPQNN